MLIIIHHTLNDSLYILQPLISGSHVYTIYILLIVVDMYDQGLNQPI